MLEKKYIWISLHLFYSQDTTRLFCAATSRYVRWVLKSGIVHRFFFIQSQEQGPHFRLRFQTRVESKDILQANLEEYFSNFLEDNPSKREEPNFSDELVEKNIWKRNNYFEFGTYHETPERFGGELGMNICLRQFQISSIAVLNFYEQQGAGSILQRSDVLSNAFSFNFTFALAMGMPLEDISLFFKQIFNQWLPKAYAPDDIDLIPYYTKQFQLDKAQLKQNILMLLDAVETNDILEDEIFGNWFINNKNIAKTFSHQSDFFEPRSPAYAVAFTPDVDPQNYTIWSIWMDLIHLHNNRMSVVNQEESYLAFILFMTVDEIIGKKIPVTA